MRACEKIEALGVLPVINVTSEELAQPLAKSLIDGGIPAIEVTLRSECSLKAIEIIKSSFPEMTVGAGTVLSIESVDKALAAGADYIVTPGFDEEIVGYCINKGVEVVPGCSTASEIQRAVKMGLRVLKFFPAELSGGIAAVKLLAGPFSGVKFLPTGGITFNNLGEYLKCDKVAACGGSFMATADQLKNRKFDEITAACKKALDISLGFELAHIGINHKDDAAALKTAEILASIFNMNVRKCSSSTFAGNAVECMNSEKYGDKGHIGFATNSMTRAMSLLASKGIELDPDSYKYDAAGNITCVYFKEQVAGFALHIVKK